MGLCGHFLGYIDTWSATRRLEKEQGRGPFEAVEAALRTAWGDSARRRPVRWPLVIRAGRVD
jgi:hypothetical protein